MRNRAKVTTRRVSGPVGTEIADVSPAPHPSRAP